MDKNDVTITAMIMTVIVVLVTAYCLGSDDKDESQFDTGHWYQVSFYGYEISDTGTEYRSSSEYDISSAYFDLKITSLEDGLFCAEYYGNSITGAYTDDSLLVKTELGDGSALYISGHIDGDMMYSHVSTIRDDGTVGVYYSIYSTDPKSVGDNPEMIDIMGSWDVSSVNAVYGGGVLDSKCSAFTVIEQKGSVFTALMEQQAGHDSAEMKIIGVFTGGTMDGYAEVHMVDMAGERWNAFVSEDRMLVFTAENDVEYGPIAVERIFTRGGADVGSFDSPDLKGTVWTETSAHNVTCWNRYMHSFNSFILSFDDQIGGLYTGTLSLNGSEYPMVAYSMGAKEVLIYSMRNGAAIVGFCNLDGGVLTMFQQFESSYYDGIVTQVTTMVQDVRIPESPVGAWESMYVQMVDQGGNVVEGQITDKATEIMLGDIIVTDFKGGVFKGYFAGIKVVGTYSDGVMNFISPSYEAYMNVTGTMINESVMEASITLVYNDGSCCLIKGIYSTNTVRAYPSLVRDITGEWPTQAGDSYSVGSEGVGMLEGNTLTVETQKMNIITGTYMKDVGGKASKVSSVGILSNYGISYLADSTGDIFVLTIGDGYLVLHRSTIGESSSRTCTDTTKQDISCSLTGESWGCTKIKTCTQDSERMVSIDVRMTLDLCYADLYRFTLSFGGSEVSMCGYSADADGEAIIITGSDFSRTAKLIIDDGKIGFYYLGCDSVIIMELEPI